MFEILCAVVGIPVMLLAIILAINKAAEEAVNDENKAWLQEIKEFNAQRRDKISNER